MTINLFDDGAWLSLRPLTLTRPVADLRVGILTIAEKWQKYIGTDGYGFQTSAYLSRKYPLLYGTGLFINGSVCPDEAIAGNILDLKSGEVLMAGKLTIAYRSEAPQEGNSEALWGGQQSCLSSYSVRKYEREFVRITFPEDIFRNNDTELKKDFELLTRGRSSGTLSSTNTLIGDQVFIEAGAEAECSTFNSKNGPIYLGKNSQVWEGSNIRGSFALCHDSQVKMGAKIYGQTTIGPYCRVGGEINNAVIWGYSSKGHEGYLGNSVLGQWCNIGADSNNSNLKNNYAEVKLWDYSNQKFRKTGLQFCGLIMADHSKCGINTMFNTGTVAGVSANIFGGGFPRNYIPDFAWGGPHGFEIYSLDKMFKTSELVFQRRDMEFGQIEKDILIHIFEDTKTNRHF